MQDSRGDTVIKNRLLDSVRERESGMIWHDSTEMYTIPCVNQTPSGSLMYAAGNPKPVLCDSQEGWSQHVHLRKIYIDVCQVSSVQALTRVRFFATPWTSQASLSITNSRSPPKPMSIDLVMPSNILILCHPLLFLPSIFTSIMVFSNESALHMRWPKYWSSSFNISLSSEHPGLISLRMDCLDLLAVQGTLKSLLQHRNSKASILQCSAFFIFFF